MESNNIQESIGGRYIIHKERGSGTTSEVFKVQDNNTQNIYAAKVFKKQSPYFQREIGMLTALRPTNNPFMINIIDSGIGTVIRKDQTQNNKQYIILDYTPKDELLQYLCLINEPLKELHAKLIFFKILKGVQNCHNAGICHLDLKTDNILLDEKFVPKLCDFGFAIRNNGHLREFLGTQQFAAPEIFRKKSFDGYKADIFSLGVVLLNLTTCKFGFGAAVQNDEYYIYIMAKYYDQYWQKLKNIAGISENLKNLYVKMVAYKPSERPTIEEIINSEWMRELREMNNEQLAQLENEVRGEFLRREPLMIAAKEKEKQINNELFGSNNSSGNRGFTADNGLFDLNLKPCYAKSKLNMDNYIKLTGNINPGKFMNDLVAKINKLDGAYINADKDEFKLNVTFEKEEKDFEIPENMKEELKKLGIYENEEDDEEENENIKGRRIVVKIKIYQSYNGGYLLKFAKKEGVLIDYLEKVRKINSLIQEM